MGTRLKEHKVEYEKAMNTKYTHNTRKQSESEISKHDITDHAKQCNHIIDWEGGMIKDTKVVALLFHSPSQMSLSLNE